LTPVSECRAVSAQCRSSVPVSASVSRGFLTVDLNRHCRACRAVSECRSVGVSECHSVGQCRGVGVSGCLGPTSLASPPCGTARRPCAFTRGRPGAPRRPGTGRSRRTAQIGKQGCRDIFNMCGDLVVGLPHSQRIAPENFGPFTLFLVKSRRVAPGNFWGICLASVKFTHLGSQEPSLHLFPPQSTSRRRRRAQQRLRVAGRASAAPHSLVS